MRTKGVNEHEKTGPYGYARFCCFCRFPPARMTGAKAKSRSKNVRLAEVTHSIFYAPQYVALAKGFFKEEGLDVELTTTWGGDKTMTTLLSGGADIALVGSETSIYVYSQGTDDPVINFAQLTQTDGTFLVSRKKTRPLYMGDVERKHVPRPTERRHAANGRRVCAEKTRH